MTDELGASLPAHVLTRRLQLPAKPEPVTLEGHFVRLSPLKLDLHADALFRVSSGSPVSLGDRSIGSYDCDALVWRYMSAGPFESASELQAFLAAQLESVDGHPLCAIHVGEDRPVGVANFLANMPPHLKIELGNIWYSPVVQGTKINTEATYLMLNHVFELGYRRVEWKCDSLNARSRRAALRMGFSYEGIQEHHYVIKGRNRDTAWFRMLDRDWPEARKKLETFLYG